MPSGIPGPTWPGLPSDTSSADIGRLFVHAVQCSIIGYIGALSIGRVVAREFGYVVDESQELFAAGAANIITAFAKGFPVQASFSRTAVNVGSGGRSSMSGLISSALLMLICQFLMPTLAVVPDAALGSIVFVVIFRLIELPEAVRMWRTDKRDLVVGLAVFVVVSCYTVGAGLMVGIVLQWISGYTRGFTLLSETTVVELGEDAATGSWRPALVAGGKHAQRVGSLNGGAPHNVNVERVAILRFGCTDLQVCKRNFEVLVFDDTVLSRHALS
jgi:MFS superfamily sulfate permease-like transporter